MQKVKCLLILLGFISSSVDAALLEYSNDIFVTFFHHITNGSPKVISSNDLQVLLRIYRRTKNKEALKMVQATLDHASQGDVYDRAALANAYLEAFEVTKKPEYEVAVRMILDHVLRDMRGPEISVLAKAGRALHEQKYNHEAEKGAEFILTRWMSGKTKPAPLVEDYAFMIDALIELYQSTFNIRWLSHAKSLQKEQDRLFADTKNAMSVLNLLRLSDLFVDRSFRERALRTLNAYSKEAVSSPEAFPQMLIALDYALDRSKEIAVIGNTSDGVTIALIQALTDGFNPNQVIAVGLTGTEDPPLLSMRPLYHGKPTAYVCVNHACKLPTNDPDIAKTLAQDYEPYSF